VHLQSSLPKQSFLRKLEKKMNGNQNSAVLVKFYVGPLIFDLSHIHP
jgi:hypothetical protein